MSGVDVEECDREEASLVPHPGRACVPNPAVLAGGMDEAKLSLRTAGQRGTHNGESSFEREHRERLQVRCFTLQFFLKLECGNNVKDSGSGCSLFSPLKLYSQISILRR